MSSIPVAEQAKPPKIQIGAAAAKRITSWHALTTDPRADALFPIGPARPVVGHAGPDATPPRSVRALPVLRRNYPREPARQVSALS